MVRDWIIFLGVGPEEARKAYYLKDYAQEFIAIAVGGAHFTKQIPIELLQEIIHKSPYSCVLLGGPDDIPKAKLLAKGNKKFWIYAANSL
jgi:hypothetical protein